MSVLDVPSSDDISTFKDVAAFVAECKRRRDSYPTDHNQRPKIAAQIARMS